MEVGQVACFNKSGDVARGVITRITPSATFIHKLDGSYGSGESRVRNGRSIFVLKEGDHRE
jgi:hypothetical protein